MNNGETDSIESPESLLVPLTGTHIENILSASEALPPSKHQKYRQNNPAYREREHKRNRMDNESYRLEFRREAIRHRPFVGWDSEGSNLTRSVFLWGSSRGDAIHGEMLSSTAMFDLVLRRERDTPDAIHIIYGGEYDFNMMLKDVPRRNLEALKRSNKTQWGDYRLEHIPRKWFVISKDGVTAKIFDIVSFFGCRYDQALKENGIGTVEDLERITAGKNQRSDFSYADIDYIKPYWQAELRYLPELADKLRTSFDRAGMAINSWHGPGALARYILRHHKISEAMNRELPQEVRDASRYAFCGGRFESFQAGLHVGRVGNADINSAYPYAATLLPDLHRGSWKYVNTVDRSSISKTQFALYHISYQKLNPERSGLCMEPQPLFRRFKDDRVMWPNTVTGWYWSPEAVIVADSPHATFLEAWIYHDDGSRPFQFLNEYYQHRLRLQAAGDSMELAFKLGPNSVYGQTAQRAGWEYYNGPPKYHQLEWAGFITSFCRSMVHEAACAAWQNNSLISIDTDGIFTTDTIRSESLYNREGGQLGQWKVKYVDGILNWQSGVYWMPDNEGQWLLKKARGAPKGKIPYANAIKALQTLEPIEYVRNEFIGYRWGLRNGMENWRYFVQKDRQIQFGGSEYSKRWHNPRGCRLCRGYKETSLHDLSPNSNGFAPNPHSKMHVLPWEKNDHERARDPIDEKNDATIDAIWTEEP